MNTLYYKTRFEEELIPSRYSSEFDNHINQIKEAITVRYWHTGDLVGLPINDPTDEH